MQLAAFVLSTVLAGAATLPAQSPVVLQIDPFPSLVKFRVAGPQAPFLGAVLLSFRDTRSNQVPGVPALLDDFVVAGVGAGAARGEYVVGVPTSHFPRSIKVYAQGLVADGGAIGSSAVGSLLVN